MYNEKILNQLDNLKYLGALKGSNIAVVSKTNEFGDAVKFYAQINKEDIIQKITYRASGCTHFLVFCNYFCSLVEGKTVKSALNVNAEKLENFVELDEGKKHIISIILDAFAMLIKRYRKGVDKGKIVPSEVIQMADDSSKSRPMSSKAFTKVVGEIIKNIELSQNDDTNFTNTDNSNYTFTKLMVINNIKHKEIEEKKATEEAKLVVEKVTKKVVKIDKDSALEVKVNEDLKTEEVFTENKTTKRGKKVKEEIPVQTKSLDKDELLENLIDEGIFLDDYLANNSKKEEQPVEEKVAKEEVVEEKPKKATRKSSKKAKKEPVVAAEEEKSIEELNKEITGLIDIMETDEVAPQVETQPEQKSKEENKVDEPKKQKKVVKKETKMEAQKAANKVEKAPKKAEVKEEKLEPVQDKTTAQEKQNSNLLALKSMLSNRNTSKTETKLVEEKKVDTKVNNLTAMISKMNNNKTSDTKIAKTEQKTEKPVEKKEDRLSSLKLSLANMQSKNETTSKSASEKNVKNTKKAENKKPAKVEKTTEKQEKVKKEKTKVEKTKPAKKEVAKKENKKVEKKPVEKKEKQPKETAPKKVKKNSYDMEYETIDYSEKKGFFSWLKRK